MLVLLILDLFDLTIVKEKVLKVPLVTLVEHPDENSSSYLCFNPFLSVRGAQRKYLDG